MDVGLNNKNTLHLALDNPYMEDIEWVVEATWDERHNLWKEYHEKRDWKEVGTGQVYTILNLEVTAKSHKGTQEDLKNTKEVLPVCIEFSYAIIDGHKICFYTSNSRLVHHGYIEAFLLTYFQRTHDKYTRWNHTDATNFHNCIGYLDTVDKKPRNTIYKPNSYEEKYFMFKKVEEAPKCVRTKGGR